MDEYNTNMYKLLSLLKNKSKDSDKGWEYELIKKTLLENGLNPDQFEIIWKNAASSGMLHRYGGTNEYSLAPEGNVELKKLENEKSEDNFKEYIYQMGYEDIIASVFETQPWLLDKDKRDFVMCLEQLELINKQKESIKHQKRATIINIILTGIIAVSTIINIILSLKISGVI